MEEVEGRALGLEEPGWVFVQGIDDLLLVSFCVVGWEVWVVYEGVRISPRRRTRRGWRRPSSGRALRVLGGADSPDLAGIQAIYHLHRMMGTWMENHASQA